MKVTADAARRFLVARHLLAPPRSLDGGPDAVLEVFRRLGSVQFDPLAVAGRNHDLVLHARVADYDPAWCELLYERRKIFEAYNKGLSFVPTSELMTLDLPTLERPRNATSGIVGAGKWEASVAAARKRDRTLMSKFPTVRVSLARDGACEHESQARYCLREAGIQGSGVSTGISARTLPLATTRR